MNFEKARLPWLHNSGAAQAAKRFSGSVALEKSASGLAYAGKTNVFLMPDNGNTLSMIKQAAGKS